MPKCDPNIYGADPVTFANGCADFALNPSKLREWEGDPIDQSAMSKGGGNDKSVSDGTAATKTVGGGNDSRAISKGGHAATSTFVKTKKD